MIDLDLTTFQKLSNLDIQQNHFRKAGLALFIKMSLNGCWKNTNII
jgi:hypothetical protein